MAERKLTDKQIRDFVNRPENKPNMATSAITAFADNGSKALNALSFGYVPTLQEYVVNRARAQGIEISPEAARSLINARREASTVGDNVGGALGWGAGAGAALAGGGVVGGTLRAAAPYAAAVGLPVVYNVASKAPSMTGTAVATAKAGYNAAKPYWWSAAKGAGLLSIAPTASFLAGNDTAPLPDEPAPAANAGTGAGSTAKSGGSSANDYWASRMGVRPEDVAAIRKQYGGIPLYFVDQFSKSRPDSPGYEDVLGSMVLKQLEASSRAAEESGNAEQQKLIYEEMKRILFGNEFAQ